MDIIQRMESMDAGMVAAFQKITNVTGLNNYLLAQSCCALGAWSSMTALTWYVMYDPIFLKCLLWLVVGCLYVMGIFHMEEKKTRLQRDSFNFNPQRLFMPYGFARTIITIAVFCFVVSFIVDHAGHWGAPHFYILLCFGICWNCMLYFMAGTPPPRKPSRVES